MAYAAQYSALLHVNYIGPEHLMLAICADPESLAARTLNHLGANHETVLNYINRTLGPGDTPSPTNLRTTPRFNEIVQTAANLAEKHGCRYVDTRHIMIQLIHNPHTVMAYFFNQRNITEDIFESTASILNPTK